MNAPSRLERADSRGIYAVYEGEGDALYLRVDLESDDTAHPQALSRLRDEIVDGYNRSTEESIVRHGDHMFRLGREGVYFGGDLVISADTLYEWEAYIQGRQLDSGHQVGPLDSTTTFSVSLPDGHTVMEAKKIAKMCDRHRSLYG